MSRVSIIQKRARGSFTMILMFVLLFFIFSNLASAAQLEEERKVNPEYFIAVDGSHNIAYNNHGDVWYWGNMFDFDPPNITYHDNAPVRMGTMNDIAQVSSKLFLKKDGSVWSWYAGPYPASDHSQKLQFQIQKPVAFDLADIIKIEAGSTYHSAIKKDGTVWVWLPLPGSKPVQIPNITDAVDLAYSYQGSQSKLAIVKKDGSVWKWSGSTPTGNSTPVPAIQMDGLADITNLFKGDQCFFAVKNDGTIWGWGNNLHGQLGLTEQRTYETPELIPGLTDIVSIAGTASSTFALKKDGTVWSWGFEQNRMPEIGATIHPEPQQIKGLTDVEKIACGGAHVLVVLKDGSLWAWGSNVYGQLGDGTFRDSEKPIPVILK